ncbi:NAD kinase [Flavobacteriales bacterium]|nr:NAD kinase [Flavobacteriales bacterium]
MRIAIYGREFSDDFIPYFQLLIDELDKLGIDYFVYSKFHKNVVNKGITFGQEVKEYTRKSYPKLKLDFLFSIGGDGTILDTLTSIKKGIPVVGVNSGRLGFLSNTAKTEIKKVIQQLMAGDYRIEERTMLNLETKAKLFGKYNFALNELTVHKKDSSSMITIHVFVNGLFLNSYWADGLIIATPTGSTAYSLSCGGPIVMPNSENFVITPIAPHNLNIRPIIVSDDSEIEIKVEGREEKFLATLDSRSEEISTKNTLLVSKSKLNINLVQFPNQNFFKTIRNKLYWGLDKRN